MIQRTAAFNFGCSLLLILVALSLMLQLRGKKIISTSFSMFFNDDEFNVVPKANAL